MLRRIEGEEEVKGGSVECDLHNLEECTIFGLGLSTGRPNQVCRYLQYRQTDVRRMVRALVSWRTGWISRSFSAIALITGSDTRASKASAVTVTA
jgi:hypothetical protein